MSQGPKLYAHKPTKKAHLKQFQDEPISASPSSTMASSHSSTPIFSFIRRYKYIWPLVIGFGYAFGVRLLLQTPRKEKIDVEEEVTTAFSAVAQTTSTAQRSVKLREPISEDQQRDALKWILEEKGKVKPKDREEKKRIDEEKALLKQLIRAKSLPRI